MYIPMTTSPEVSGRSKDHLQTPDTRLSGYMNASYQPVHGGWRILVMDDEEALLDLASTLLSHFGYRPGVARDGEEAIALYKEAADQNDPFSVVIMDLTISGGLGGVETIARLHEIDPFVVAVVSSGHFEDPVVENFRQYGFAGILTKPYTAKEMCGVIKKVMSPKGK